MASAQGIRAGAAYVELYAQDNRLVRGLESAQRRLKAFSASVSDIGGRMLRTGAVFATPFLAGTKVFADFEQQMANVATMLQDPTLHMARFRQGIRSMSEEFGESTETLAKSLYDILSASVPAEAALDVLAVSARAAKAGLTDTGTAADAITTVLNAYGLSAQHAASVSDLLFSIVARGKTTLGQLAPNIGKVATLAASADLSLEELGASIATLTRNGISTEQSMTAVAAILASFLKPSAEGAEAARELGFELNAATLKAEGLSGVLARLSALPPDALARIFPNVEALRGLLPALRNLEGFTDDVESMRRRAGATEKAYAQMAKTLTTSFARLKQSAISVLSVIGESIAQPVSQAATAIRRYLVSIRQWVQDHQQAVAVAFKVVGVLAALGAALVAVGVAGQAMAFVMGGIGSIVSGIGTVFGILGSAIAAIVSPIGLVITALVTLAAYLIYATGTGARALDWLSERFQDLKAFATQSLQGISDALAAGDIPLAARVLWLSLQLAWRKGISVIQEYWLSFKGWFLDRTTDLFYGAVAALEQAWSGLQVIWVETAAFMANVWTRFTQGVGHAWNVVQDWLTKRIVELWGLFDEDIDVEATQRLIEEDTQKRTHEIDREAGSTLARREQQRQEERQRIATERSGTLAAIANMADAEERERRERHERELQDSQHALEEARQEWQDAIAEAREKRAAFEAGPGRPGEKQKPNVEVPDIAKRLQESLQGVAERVEEAVRANFDVAGTFNIAAAQGLGVGASVQERTAKASEETARNTKRIVQKMDEEGLVFE